MDFLWLALGLTTVMSWVAFHRCVVSMRQKLFRRIREFAPESYDEILGPGKAAWLEKGWYSPTDLPVLRRLHRGLLSGKFEGLLSEDELKKYRTLVRRRRYAGIGFFFVFIPGTALLMAFGVGG